VTQWERDAFWDRPEMAERMGNRPPDHRFVALADRGLDLEPILDVGCAGGRNTAFAAERGLKVIAFDVAATMVAATRARLAPHLGEHLAEERVRQLDLSSLGDVWPASEGPFGLILALGVLQDLPDAAAFERALQDLFDLCKPGGLVLIANFGADSQPDGVPLRPLEGSPHVYLGFGHGGRPMTMPDPSTLDAWAQAAGFEVDVPTDVRTAETEAGFRTTLNAQYRRPRER